MVEVWKDIAGFEGLYQVSTLGNVKSLNYLNTGKEKILRPGFDKKYLEVQLCKDGKRKHYKVHRLVAEAFIPNSFKLPCVNHKDENKLNNCVNNLEWCSYSYNNTYNDKHLKVAEKTSIPIYCIEVNKIFTSANEAERRTGIYHSSIIKCCKGKLKSAGGFHWKYV